jgi:hypothetical protein
VTAGNAEGRPDRTALRALRPCDEYARSDEGTAAAAFVGSPGARGRIIAGLGNPSPAPDAPYGDDRDATPGRPLPGRAARLLLPAEWLAPERFLPPQHAARVTVDEELGCWLWTGALDSSGYAVARIDGRVWRVHRWVLTVTGRGDAEHTDHRCRVRACVNPCHVAGVTARDNWWHGESPSARFAREGRCGRGHDLTAPGALYTAPSGRRMCAACVAVRAAVRRAVRRAAAGVESAELVDASAGAS